MEVGQVTLFLPFSSLSLSMSRRWQACPLCVLELSTGQSVIEPFLLVGSWLTLLTPFRCP